jgi:hypothetical protein
MFGPRDRLGIPPAPLPCLVASHQQDAERQGSNTNKIRTSLLPVDPGRSSFRFLIFEPVIVPTRGRPDAGPEQLSA